MTIKTFFKYSTFILFLLFFVLTQQSEAQSRRKRTCWFNTLYAIPKNTQTIKWKQKANTVCTVTWTRTQFGFNYVKVIQRPKHAQFGSNNELRHALKTGSYIGEDYFEFLINVNGNGFSGDAVFKVHVTIIE